MGEISNREELIAEMCRSGKYDTSFIGDEVVNKCNLFVDDALKKHWNITLPRHSESELWSRVYPGWKDRPMKASALDVYLEEASNLSTSGVKKVSHKEAASLSNQGKLVVGLATGHATIFAPSTGWPTVYRSDLSIARRGNDRRIKVGLRPNSYLRAFHINPERYKKYRGSNKAKEVARP